MAFVLNMAPGCGRPPGVSKLLRPYISCNTATQASDLAILDEKYTVEKVQLVDVFPTNHHVEDVVLLVKH